MSVRTRRLTGTAALLAASALALAGCGGTDTEDAKADAPAATATSARPTPTPTPSPTPTPTPRDTPAPTPKAVTLDDHTGATVGKAIAAAKKAGLDYVVRLQGTGGRKASSWSSGEKVCAQSDEPDGSDVAFTLARNGYDCSGHALYTPKPTPKPAKPGGTGGTTSGGTSGGGSGSGSGTCELKSPAGNCYADGQFCANAHHGLHTHGRGGEYLTCAQDAAGRWRWSDGVAG